MKDRVGKLKTVEDHKKDINYHERRVKSAKQRRDKVDEASRIVILVKLISTVRISRER